MSKKPVSGGGPVAAFTSVSRELLRHPFSSGDDLAKRPASERLTYLLTAVLLFAITASLGVAMSSAHGSTTLTHTQWAVLGLVVAALVIGNAVALVLARTSRTKVEGWRFTAAAQYLVGLTLAGLAVLTAIGLVGQLVLPDWHGSLPEAVVVVGTLGVGVLATMLVLEVPRRILHLSESTYYGVVALLFLVVSGAATSLGLIG